MPEQEQMRWRTKMRSWAIDRVRNTCLNEFLCIWSAYFYGIGMMSAVWLSTCSGAQDIKIGGGG